MYKIIFADGKWYYGVRRIRGISPILDRYYGSPVTNKEHWSVPHSKIVLKEFESVEEACEYEKKLIKPELNNPQCLNECANLTFSYEVNKKAREKATSLRKGKPLSEQHKRNISLAQKGRKSPEEEAARLRVATLGMSWWNNGETEIFVKGQPEGTWFQGRLKDCFATSSRTRGWKWYNDGATSKMFDSEPGAPWRPGRIRPKGKKWYNNGTDHVLAFVCPGEGWVPGRLSRK